MASMIRTAVDFYENHRISAQIILTKLEAARGTLDGLRPDELFPRDQDHYGGTAANDALAKCAHIGSGTKVVDLCAGPGGPARYLAHRYGAFVIGIELTPARVAGASELTQLVGLSSQVQVVEGNVTALPLPDASQDAVVSQEALFHVPDLARALSEAHRVLRPGGRIAFTDWIAHEPLSAADEQLLWDGMAAATLINIDRHAELLRRAGFEIESIEDETDRWASFSPSACACTRRSARASSEGGTSRPSSLAIFKLTIRSKTVGCSIGRSAGLVPLSTRST